MLPEYSNEVYTHVVALVRDEDKVSRQWLLDNDGREWVEFWDACEGMEKSFKWLMENGYRHLAATSDAISGQDSAKVWLMRSGFRDLAAFTDAVTGNKNAVVLLVRLKQKGLVLIAREMHLKNKKQVKKGIWGLLNFGNPFR